MDLRRNRTVTGKEFAHNREKVVVKREDAGRRQKRPPASNKGRINRNRSEKRPCRSSLSRAAFFRLSVWPNGIFGAAIVDDLSRHQDLQGHSSGEGVER